MCFVISFETSLVHPWVELHCLTSNYLEIFLLIASLISISSFEYSLYDYISFQLLRFFYGPGRRACLCYMFYEHLKRKYIYCWMEYFININ
jgi:hypothetical protein